MTEKLSFRLNGEADMVSFGQVLGNVLGRGIIFLEGNLGAGKTTLCRGILQALGHRGAVKSPTYTLVEPYDIDGRRVFHFDLYRLGNAEELEFMGIRDYFGDDCLCLLEWPERGSGFLPDPDLHVSIEGRSSSRTVQLEAKSERGQQALFALAANEWRNK